MRSTHTYATLEVSNAAYKEITEKLRKAGYHHAFIENRSNGVDIDMHGIALVTKCDHDWDGKAGDTEPFFCCLCGVKLDA